MRPGSRYKSVGHRGFRAASAFTSATVFMPVSVIRIASVALILIATVALGTGCAEPREDSNPLILNASDSLLVNVLIDLHAVDARLYTVQMNTLAQEDDPVALDFSKTGPRDSVLAVHGLDSTSFNQLIEEHLDQPDRFLMVYNRVLDKAASQ